MSRETYQFQFVGITAFLVLTLGLVTWATLRYPHPEAANASVDDRAPASQHNINISENPADGTKLNGQVETLDLKCITHGQILEHQTQARHLRLVGRLCPTEPLKTNKYPSPDIVNETNGFLATVFVPESNLFTSDYIYLAQGKNQVRLTWTSEKGEKIQSEFVINREVPISDTSPASDNQ
jgi:hypothetical protein